MTLNLVSEAKTFSGTDIGNQNWVLLLEIKKLLHLLMCERPLKLIFCIWMRDY